MVPSRSRPARDEPCRRGTPALALAAALICPLGAAAQTLVTSPAPFLTTNLLSGSRGQRMNIVVLGDGYTAAQASLFQTHVTNVVLNHLFTVEPFRSYRSYHNVFSITAASLESGADHPSLGTSRDTYFDATYDTSGIARLLTLKLGSRVSSLLSQLLPDYDYVLVIVNDSAYGGSGGPYAITSAHSTAPQIALHELGHSFGSLADEYEDFTPGYFPAERVNCTAQTNRATTKWAAWIESSTAIPTPEKASSDGIAGLFEGCMYTNAGWYRPHYNSFMRAFGQPVGQINSDQIVKRFYKHTPDHIDPFHAFSPPGTNLVINGIQTIAFAVAALKPDFHSLAVAWTLDDVVQSGQHATNWSVNTAAIGLGRHTVACTVSDPTPQVRIHTNTYFPTDPMRKTVLWNFDVQSLDPPSVTITNPTNGATLPMSSNITIVAVASASNGIARIEFFADGTKIGDDLSSPYSAAWSPTAPGDHTLTARAIASLGETNTSAPVAVSLVNDPWSAWRNAHFTSGEAADPTIGSETADPDADGIPNLLEYALDLNPTAGDPTGLPSPHILAGRLTLVYTRSLGATDVVCTVEVADSPAGPWRSGPPHIFEEILSADASSQTIRATDLAANAPARFMRLRLTKQ